jgi:hypothetical protein
MNYIYYSLDCMIGLSLIGIARLAWIQDSDTLILICHLILLIVWIGAPLILHYLFKWLHDRGTAGSEYESDHGYEYESDHGYEYESDHGYEYESDHGSELDYGSTPGEHENIFESKELIEAMRKEIEELKKTLDKASDKKSLYSRFVAMYRGHKSSEVVNDGVNHNSMTTNSSVCVVCMESTYNTAFSSCGHVCCCDKCAKVINKCPICRKKITNRIRVYI